MRTLSKAIAAGLYCLWALPASAQLFQDIAGSVGIGTYAQAPLMGGGVAAADFDEDGDIDLFVPNTGGFADQLYVNLGDGRFAEQATQRGLAHAGRSRTALWVDVDNDGDLDLLVGTDCFGFQAACSQGGSGLRLYTQESNGNFVERTEAAGLVEDMRNFGPFQHRGGLAAGDIDNDGDLDVYAAIWDSAEPAPAIRGAASGSAASRLYRNNGDGSFTDISAAAGVLLGGNSGQWQPLMFDLDRDGWTDIFVSVDFGANLWWRNLGNGQFSDQAAAVGLAYAGNDLTLSGGNDMGAVFGDDDGDGDFDLYLTNIVDGYFQGERNVLLRNLGGTSPQFADVTASAGVGETAWGWGATFVDGDLDGDLDLAVTNGFSVPQYVNDRSCYFRQEAPGQYFDRATLVGFDDTLWGSTVIAADLDNDGSPELIQTTKVHPDFGPLRIMRSSSSHAWLKLRPRQRAGNRQAIGAVVHLRHADRLQSRLISAGTSFLGQEPAEGLFGLGADTTSLASIHLSWPDGRESLWDGIAPRQVLSIDDDRLATLGFE